MTAARHFVIVGTVQGVGFRPYVTRLARSHGLAGWVINADQGVEIHVEGQSAALDAFTAALRSEAPPAAQLVAVDMKEATPAGVTDFVIRESARGGAPTARISPDLPVCDACLAEMRDARARRFAYPYINCTNCGPRYSVIRALPYDRRRTTMADWPLCTACRLEYEDPADRRFHAEPIACAACGPGYSLSMASGDEPNGDAFDAAAQLLRAGAIVAVKGIGGYHLSCDARNGPAVRALRERKYRKSRPFAVMARDLSVARSLVRLNAEGEALLSSPARPIVLLAAAGMLAEVAPDRRELGVMLPYAPVHHLLFGAGAPDVLVMTSGNRSNEPIAYLDDDARARLEGIADAFLVGGREIARRVDDSVVRPGEQQGVLLRRARGYAPGVVARLPSSHRILAVGADLKNTVTLVVAGDAVMSQHVGDLDHLPAVEAFWSSIRDLMAMYALTWADVVIAHDQHPHYATTQHALALPVQQRIGVQHHRAHIASVLAERHALDKPVVGIAFDGTGYGDDGTIWGGEFFAGSVLGGLSRVASLQPFLLPGGDAAARAPVQAAAGALHALDGLPDLMAPPFSFPKRYAEARQLATRGVRTFTCTSAGRLFDSAAAILGFTRDAEYEGEAAEWLEQLAWRAPGSEPLLFDANDVSIDGSSALRRMIRRRLEGDDVAVIAHAFHQGLAQAVAAIALHLCEQRDLDTIVVSGGTFQNALLLAMFRSALPSTISLWTNEQVPCNDGGISLGQAALASVGCAAPVASRTR